MKNLKYDNVQLFEAFLKSAQYLVRLSSEQDVWEHLSKFIATHFPADWTALVQKDPHGLRVRHCTLPEEAGLRLISTDEVKTLVADVLNTGFLASQVILAPRPSTTAFLPIAGERKVILIGHDTAEPIPKELLNTYLAIAGLAATTLERLRAEGALRSAGSYNRNLLEASLDPLVTIGPDGKITDVNAATETVTGYSRDRLIGTDFSEYFTEPKEARAGYQQVFREGAVRDYPLEVRHKDGHITPVLYNASVYKDDTGKVIGVFAAARDITEIKRAEGMLQKLASQNKLILDSAGEGILGMDASGNHTFANPAAARMLGWEVEELIGRQSHSIWHHTRPDGSKYPEEECGIHASARYGVSRHESEEMFWKKDGTSIPVEYTSTPVWEDGKPVGVVVTFSDITERKRAEEALQASERRYRMLFDSIDEGFCIVEVIFDEHERPVDYRFLEINPSFEKQTGLIDAKGKRMRELAPEHEEFWFETYGKIALTGEPARFQNIAEQLHRWYDVYAFRFGQPENRQVAILFNDITERRRTEEALRESEERFRLLVDSAQDYAIIMLDTDGRVVSWNEGSQRMKGYTAPEIIGKHFSRFYSKDDIRAGKPEQELKIASDTGRFEDEGIRVRKDGSHFQANVVINAIRDKAGKLRGFSKITRDITEHKQTEEVLRASVRLGEYSLKHSLDELLTYILDEAESLTGSRIGFFHFLETDQKTLRLQTWSTNTLKNMCTAEGKGAHYSVDEAGVWVEAIKERRPVVHNDYNSLPGRKGLPAGHAPVIREMVVPIFRGGEIMAVIGVGNKPEEYIEQDLKAVSQIANRAWDIILAKRAQDEIKKLNEELEQRVVERTTELTAVNKELEAFTYSVSHDLRAPLRHIHGFVDLLVQNSSKNLDEKGKRYLTTISKAASQMGNLVDDLLSFSRMGRAEIKKHSVDLGKMVYGVIDDMKYEVRERDIEWKVGKLAPIYGDPSMLRLVMVNLISNAVKFTRGRDKALIEIGSYTEAGEDVVCVKDNGVGFDMRYVGKLFGVFQRLHSMEEFEGTGIGLANVQRIISRHGGRTWAEGELGKGAAFYFSLPSRDRNKV